MVTEKFLLPIDRLSQLTNGQSEYSSHSHETRTKKAQCKRTFIDRHRKYYKSVACRYLTEINPNNLIKLIHLFTEIYIPSISYDYITKINSF